MGPVFDWTFRAGDILPLVGGIFVAMAFLYRRGGQEVGMQLTLEALTKELTEMKTQFKSFGETLNKVAIQEMQIGLLMKWYDELRRGKGIIVDKDD
jgi:hypothetical protein